MFIKIVLFAIVSLALFAMSMLKPSDARADNTGIADIIIPEVFNPYVVQRTMELSELIQSGIAVNDPVFDALAKSPGKTFNMPYWSDLSGASEVLSDTGALTPAKITGTNKDVAVLLMRGKAWSVNDLAQYLSGDDPMRVIGNLVADYWKRELQAVLISTLKGVFGAASMATNLLDVSSLAGTLRMFNGLSFNAACQKLGDAKASLAGVMIHSATETVLLNQDLITTIRDSEGKEVMRTFAGKRVIVDDSCPETGGVYTSYIFGPGAIALGNGVPPVETETYRDALAGNNGLVNRKHMILHPRGIPFQSVAVAGDSPTNAELETQTNWVKSYETKAIKIVAFKHKNTSAD